jgi:microcystin-dependent protein/predicted nucleic acid binding AN1-type Zn finger protein
MSVRTIEGGTLSLSELRSPTGQQSLTINDQGVVIVENPNPSIPNSIASTTYVNNQIANATNIGMDPTHSYEWTSPLGQSFTQPIQMGNNLPYPITIPQASQTCNSNQFGTLITDNQYAKGEIDLYNYAGNQVGGLSLTTLSDTQPTQQIMTVLNTRANETIMNLKGVSCDYQINGTSIIVDNPVSATQDNHFTQTNTFAHETDLNGQTNLNGTTTVSGTTTFQQNTLTLSNTAYPTFTGNITLSNTGSITAATNQSTQGLTIKSAGNATSFYADSSSRLNLGFNGLYTSGNIFSNNFTSTGNMNANTMNITGLALAPTAPIGTNTQQLATCEYVQQNQQSLVNTALLDADNIFTGSNTFQSSINDPIPITLSYPSQTGTASLSYNQSDRLKLTSSALTLSTGTVSCKLTVPSNDILQVAGSNVITQTSLNTTLNAYATTSYVASNYVSQTTPSFSSLVNFVSGFTSASGSIAGSAIITENSLSTTLQGYAPNTNPIITGTLTADTIRSNGAISALSGKINNSPIVTSANLTGALTNYAQLSGATFTGNLAGNVANFVSGAFSSGLSLAGNTVATLQSVSNTLSDYARLAGATFTGSIYAPYINISGQSVFQGNITLQGLLNVCPTTPVSKISTPNGFVNNEMLVDYVASNSITSAYFTGQIISSIAANSPTINDGFIFCNGQIVFINDFPKLFAAIGTTWGGDGINTFGVPDMATEGRGLICGNLTINNVPNFIVNQGSASYSGTYGGNNATTSVPNHTHSITDPGHNHGVNGGYQGATNSSGQPQVVKNAADGASLNIGTNTAFTGIHGTNDNNNNVDYLGLRSPYIVSYMYVYAL